MASKRSMRKSSGPGSLSSKPWVQTSDGVTLEVRLTLRGGRDAIEGQANTALCRLVAQELGIAPRQVEVAAGEGARIKRLRIAGDPRMLDAALDRLTKGSA